MIIFLFGNNEYRLKENAKRVVEGYKTKHKSGFNYFSFDFDVSEQVALAENAIKSMSFFAETKLIEIKNIFNSKNNYKIVEDLIEQYGLIKDKSVILLAVENKDAAQLAKANRKLFELFFKKGELVREFSLLKGAKLDNWIKSELAQKGCSIEPAALKKLISLCGQDNTLLVNEMLKLANYRSPGKIVSGDIDLLVSEKVDLNIFDFIDALGSKSRTKSFELLFKELASGRDPYYVLTMTTYQFRNLLVVRDLIDRNLSSSDIAKKSGLHPFVAKKTIVSAEKFKLEELKRLYTKLLEIDINTKLGRADLTDNIFNFVLA